MEWFELCVVVLKIVIESTKNFELFTSIDVLFEFS